MTSTTISVTASSNFYISVNKYYNQNIKHQTVVYFLFIVSTGLVTGLSITTILMILSIIINIILILFIVVTYKKSKVYFTKYN